ncbi:hypothetical protein QN222_18330 [Sinorhizobium sp. 6-70]|uniref:hypothetical protein n=1 Tax=Sinorhizobium sp. 6-70 TaxID=3049088 RepID=UPI0024C3B77A|nr:hypothetical protein [Sinorhizobium sp. 6-70]MDK1376444.1 hypothetical protein [Sinorhizobium sp. 6-70]
MVTWVMRHAGDHYVAVRGAQIDRVFKLRDELETIYRKVMHFGDDAPSKADLEAQLAGLVKKYKEIDDALADASRPLEPFTLPPAARDEFAKTFADALTGGGGKPLKNFPEQPTQATVRPHSADFADASGRMPGDPGYRIKESRAFIKEWGQDPQRPGVYLRKFADGSSAELTIVDGKYNIKTTMPDGTTLTIREGQVNVDPYARKISTTSLMNAHHGVQAHPMKAVFGDFGYDPDAAPTIWLRNSRAGSPHGRITAIEGRTGLHPSEPGSKMSATEIKQATYADMRRTAAAEMRTIGRSEQEIREYLTAHDRYFIDNILPKVKAAGKTGLLGDWADSMAGVVPL